MPSRIASGTASVRSIVRISASIAVLALVVVLGSLCLFRVDNAEYAIVTEFGKPTLVITSPGLGFKLPYQSVRTIDRRLFVYASSPTEFLTLEKTPVVAGRDCAVARRRSEEVLRNCARSNGGGVEVGRHSVC